MPFTSTIDSSSSEKVEAVKIWIIFGIVFGAVALAALCLVIVHYSTKGQQYNIKTSRKEVYSTLGQQSPNITQTALSESENIEFEPNFTPSPLKGDGTSINHNDEFLSPTAFTQEETKDGTERSATSSSTVSTKKRPIYIFWSALGAILLALASMIRGIESGKPLPAKFTLSFAYLLLSLLTLFLYRRHAQRNGSTKDFVYPWMRRIETDSLLLGDGEGRPLYRFSWTMFLAIVGGGWSEFVGSIAVIMAFNAALSANINQGIATSIMVSNIVIVSILSYFALSETISKLQLFGMAIVIGAIVIVALCSPPSSHTADQSGTAATMFWVVFWSIVGAVSVSLEVMCNKWLEQRRGVNGDINGMFFLLVEGVTGTVCLIVTTLGGGGLYELTKESFWMVMLAGVFAFLAILMISIAVTIRAGVSLAIFNLNAPLQVIISSVFLKQMITGGQIVGVILSVIGAAILTLSDSLSKSYQNYPRNK